MQTTGVAVAMSGGVDSTAAALLLLRAGYKVSGVTLQLADGVSMSAVEDARQTAAALGIPHTVLDCRTLFRSAVMDRFVSEYVRGRTPNPCIDCNRAVKFGALLDWALSQGASYLATGHYARVRRDGAQMHLLRGLDRKKDQSYVLYQLSQRQLSHLLLPLGDFDKPTIRHLVNEAGLCSANRPDSQDICFVPDGDYVAFLERYGHIVSQPGDFVDEEGRGLGRHRGLERYTIGQRKGLGVSADSRLYVLKKDLTRNEVVLGPERALYSPALLADRLCWIAGEAPRTTLRITAKTRYSQTEAAAAVELLSDGQALVTFDAPQRAITAGQAVVFYDGDQVLGGGTIVTGCQRR